MLLVARRNVTRRRHCAEQIVRVHDRVDQRVGQHQDGAVAAGREAHANVADQAHQRVMVQVQERDVALLLAQHKEHRVHVVGHLQQQVAIGAEQHILGRFRVVRGRRGHLAQHIEVRLQVRPVQALRNRGVDANLHTHTHTRTRCGDTYIGEQRAVGDHLEEIVYNDHLPQVKRFAVAH